MRRMHTGAEYVATSTITVSIGNFFFSMSSLLRLIASNFSSFVTDISYLINFWIFFLFCSVHFEKNLHFFVDGNNGEKSYMINGK